MQECWQFVAVVVLVVFAFIIALLISPAPDIGDNENINEIYSNSYIYDDIDSYNRDSTVSFSFQNGYNKQLFPIILGWRRRGIVVSSIIES